MAAEPQPREAATAREVGPSTGRAKDEQCYGVVVGLARRLTNVRAAPGEHKNSEIHFQ